MTVQRFGGTEGEGVHTWCPGCRSECTQFVKAHDYDALAAELAEWRELYEFGLNDRNELLARAQTAEAYAARNALRVIAVEAALQLIGNELSLHADKGPAGEAFRALLNPTLPETKGDET